MRLETKKFVSRFTEEPVEAVRYTGKTDQMYDIMDWVIDNKGRAQGNIRTDQGMDLVVHERGVGFVTVKPGEYVVKMNDGSFEIIAVLAFSQMYKRVSPIIKVIRNPAVLESMRFTGGKENEEEIEEWLNTHGHRGVRRHSIPGTTITYYRIEMSEGHGAIDIALNNWIVLENGVVNSVTHEDYLNSYQKVE